jgi:dimethylglycine catabolism B
MVDMVALNATDRIQDDLHLRSCIQCGDCSGVCPLGFLMDFPPSKIIAEIRSETYPRVIKTDSAWMCIACSACTTVCPMQIPVTVNVMSRTKEELVLAGNVPPELQAALENSQRYGNPEGESPRKRADWIKGIDPAIPVFGREKRSADVLWFVGDYASFHPRVQQVTRAFAQLLRLLKVDFAILGVDEVSDGDSQRLAGERGLFEYLAEKNGRSFGKYSFNSIVTTDPHAFNGFKTEYPKLGYSYPVQHYTEFLVERLDQLKPMLCKEIKAKVTYHDPCYLGRVNKIYDAPRTLLGAIHGLTLVEMPHTRQNSLCCGGGGGGMWLDGFQWNKGHARVSEWRVGEAARTGASVLVVACPYETPRFEDAVKTTGRVEQLAVKDIIELLVEAI